MAEGPVKDNHGADDKPVESESILKGVGSGVVEDKEDVKGYSDRPVDWSNEGGKVVSETIILELAVVSCDFQVEEEVKEDGLRSSDWLVDALKDGSGKLGAESTLEVVVVVGVRACEGEIDTSGTKMAVSMVALVQIAGRPRPLVPRRTSWMSSHNFLQMNPTPYPIHPFALWRGTVNLRGSRNPCTLSAH